MKKFIATFCFCYSLLAQAQTAHLVISQVYAAGGNGGALYTNDFVELYNPTASDVSLAGWSLQYAGPSATKWTSTNKVNLSGTVAAGKYFLIQLDGGANGKALPQPDFSSTVIVMSAAGGKVALVNGTALLPNGCPAGSPVVDLVGWSGSNNTNCAEGTPIKTPTDYVNGISRKNNGCTDTENTSADFETATPSPRNSALAGHTCNGTSITISAITPKPFCVDAGDGANGTVSYTTAGTFSNSTFTAVLSDTVGSFGFPVAVGAAAGTSPSGTIAINIPTGTPSGTGYRIRIEAGNPALIGHQSHSFEIINGAKNLLRNEFSSAGNNSFIKLNWTNPTGCFDEILIVAKEGSSISGTPTGDGTAYTADLNFLGNGTPFGGGKVVYKGTASGQTVTNLTNGATYFFKAYTRRGTSWSSGIEINDKPRVVPLPGEIVINQVSHDYGGTTDEYFELVNLTNKPFDLADVAIRVNSTNGVTVVAGGSLSGILAPHSFWLASPNDTITVGQTAALERNNRVDEGFGANNQIGLIRKTDDTKLDGVGYGTINVKTYGEGTAVANQPTDGGLRRKISGGDNNNNSADFMGVANADIDLRNSNSRLANANAVILPGGYATLEVTGNSSLSGSATFSNKVVLTKGVFTLDDHHLSTAKAIGGTALKYVKTSGTGALTLTNVTTDVLLPIGNSTYNPVTISNGSGLDWSVRIADGVMPGSTPFEKETAVQRTWNITPSATPPSGATVVFEYDDADATQVGSRFDKTKKVQVWNYHNGMWLSVTGPQMPVATPAGRKAVVLSSYTQFSPFVIANVNTALPVHFINFSARAQAGGVQLQFTNATEKDVSRYLIERSVNGRDFETLAQLVPEKNNGSAATYRWLDAAPPAGAAWYRIKGVDEDGTLSYTPVLKLNGERIIKALTVYPNPVRGRSVVWQATLPGGTYQLRLHSSTGQEVLRQTFEYTGGNYTATLELPAGLQPGVYQLQIGSGAFVRQQPVVVL